VIKKLHVDELNKKAAFVRRIPAFQTFSEEIIQDLASRVFFEKIPIHTAVWKQGDAVDPMKYLMIMQHGEIHVMKDFRVKKKKKKAALAAAAAADSGIGDAVSPVNTGRRGNIGAIHSGRMSTTINSLKTQRTKVAGAESDVNFIKKRADLCILGPSAAFLERSMLESSSQTNIEDLAANMEEKIMSESGGETRGCTLVSGCCCEVAWLSKHVFNQLTHYGTTRVALDMKSKEVLVAQQLAAMSKDAAKLMANLSEWILE
jgi:hypothetical protein